MLYNDDHRGFRFEGENRGPEKAEMLRYLLPLPAFQAGKKELMGLHRPTGVSSAPPHQGK